jgi:hypothetical protein
VGHDYAFFENDKFPLLDGQGQDLLWKITIPAGERITALKSLASYNITKYSLFGSEEALLSTAALEQFELTDSF